MNKSDLRDTLIVMFSLALATLTGFLRQSVIACTLGAGRVTDIYLTIGKWSSLVDDSIQFYWDHISQGTICEGAQLHFNRPLAVMRCADCGRQYEVDEDLKPCPSCGSVHLSLISGDEMQVDQIEINS